MERAGGSWRKREEASTAWERAGKTPQAPRLRQKRNPRCGSKVGAAARSGREGGNQGSRGEARQPAARPRAAAPPPRRAIAACRTKATPSQDGSWGDAWTLVCTPDALAGGPAPGPPGARSSLQRRQGADKCVSHCSSQRREVCVCWPLPWTRVPSWHCTVIVPGKHRHAQRAL